ncbi:MAG: 4-(cytidine 5'-diphospho)-2-C-methyl-D-erythritol kinase [Bacteroidales bacterium]|nr:4-(cytidine 5'-diphospho)-2-C-methyl-D-erythritol kinase [Bacteroidales bacterium]
MIVFPKAKINLGLQVTGKRSDGYHDIETIFYPVSLCDALEFVILPGPHKKDILTVTGINTGSDPENNLVIKAVRTLREKYSFPVFSIHLHKAIPVGAGLGGGSADAAYLLKAINRYFKLLISETDLKAIALELGSDCPFFINSIPSFAKGRGEILEPVIPVLKDYYLVLLNPRIIINTREAYLHCRPKKPSASLLQLLNSPITEWKELIINDFEVFAFKMHPLISEFKNELYHSGALFSLMSGSGSSVYGIFREKPKIPDKLKDFVIYEGYFGANS